MLHALDSPVSDDRLRRLLDQRSARAAIPHDRWPSADSDYSDSPSVYSSAHFSPRTYNTPAVAPSPLRLPDHPRRHPLSQPGSPLSDRERLDDPALSGLDLSDDPRFSFVSRTSSEDALAPADEDEDEDEEDAARRLAQLSVAESDQGLASHMSFLGPKMKIHAPAPWEMSDDTEADSDSSTQTRMTAASRRTKKPKASRGDGFIKGLGFAPRSSTDTRPSGESSRSGTSSKKSFDSGGALQ